MSLTTDVTFRRTDTGLSESNCTLAVNTFDTQDSVDTTGWTLTHIQNGIYELVVPAATVKSIYSLADTATGLITADGALDVASGTALDAAGTRTALGMATANMDSQLASILAAASGTNTTGVTVTRVLTGDEITLVRGDVSTITFSLGTAYNLTGRTATLTVKKTPTDTAANAILSAACTTTDAANGVCTYTTSTTTFATKGRYHFDVQVAVTGTGASPITAAIGKITVLQDVNN